MTIATFEQLKSSDPELSLPLVTLKTLITTLLKKKADTMSEFQQNIQAVIEELKSWKQHPISIMAGISLFYRFAKKIPSDMDFESWKQSFALKGEALISQCLEYKNLAADNGVKFIKEDDVILVHSYSTVVMLLLIKAAKTRRFYVYLTEARPANCGLKAVQELRDAGIAAAIISDSAVGYIIDKVDMVLVGCEGVVQSGGIINQIGTYQTAIVAKASNKPFYVCAESYKWVSLYPMNQSDLPIVRNDYFDCNTLSNPGVDYTPPQYISLIFTDFAVLTPSGVSERIIEFAL